MAPNRIIRTYAIIFLACSVAFILRMFTGQFSTELNTVLFFTSVLIASGIWESLRFVNGTLNKVMPFENNVPKRIVTQLAIGVVISLSLRLALSILGEPHISITLDRLFVATTWVLFPMATAAINSVFFAVFFFERWKDSLIKTQRLEKEKSDVQFDNLKNQLNPHFLFNALTSLNSLISEDPALASQFLQHLSRVYRYVLQNKEKNFVTVATELDFIGNYVFLAETRFTDTLKIHFDVPEALREKVIVPVTLQILIENALKHNIIDAQRPLTIDIYTADNYLIVRNNVQLKRMVETSNKQGLENLRSLYRYLTDRPIIIEQTDDVFAIKIPLL